MEQTADRTHDGVSQSRWTDHQGSAVTVLVLSYNSTSDTIACLQSLTDDDERHFAILVVDNASTDGAPAAIKARFPDIDLIELPENRGWAGGNNVGIDHALGNGAAFVCLLNNDTIVPCGAIGRLTRTAEMFAPCLVHPAIDFADPAEGAQLDPARSRHGTSRPLPEDSAVFQLSDVYGACLMISRDIFRSVGWLDERFFLQMEETDYWLRARKVGVRSLCDTGVRIVHAESRAFGSRMTPAKTYYIVRNTLLLTEKHHRAAHQIMRALRSIYWLAAKLAQQDEANRSVFGWLLSSTVHARAIRAGIRDYSLRRFGQISASALRAITSR